MDITLTPEVFVEAVRVVLMEADTDTAAVELITALVDRVPSAAGVDCGTLVADAAAGLSLAARFRIALPT